MPTFVGRDYSSLRAAIATVAWFLFGDKESWVPFIFRGNKPILNDEEINAVLCGVAESDEFQVVKRRIEQEMLNTPFNL